MDRGRAGDRDGLLWRRSGDTHTRSGLLLLLLLRGGLWTICMAVRVCPLLCVLLLPHMRRQFFRCSAAGCSCGDEGLLRGVLELERDADASSTEPEPPAEPGDPGADPVPERQERV